MHNKKKKSEIAGWLLFFFGFGWFVVSYFGDKEEEEKGEAEEVFKIITLTKIIGTFRSDYDYEYEYDF